MSDDYDKLAELTRNGYGLEEALNHLDQSVQPDGVGQDQIDTTELNPIVQRAREDDGETSTGIILIPLDDTIPQSNEGNEWMTVSITPKNAANTLTVEALVHQRTDSTAIGSSGVIALFKDSETDARAVSTGQGKDVTSANVIAAIPLNYEMVAGTTSEITFKIRGGVHVSGTVTFNGINTGRLYGGVLNSYLKVTETL